MPGERRPSGTRLCAIVDAYSSGSLLPGMLAGYGVDCVHVQSTQPMPAVYAPSFRPGDFRANVVHSGSVEDTAGALRALGVTDLLVGAECGVLLFDRLAAALGLPGNDPALSRARRDKYEMQEALRRAGLDAIAQVRSGDLHRILGWARAAGRWPVVLKPLDSAGSDGVTFCDDEQEVRRAFAALIGVTNRLGSRNDEVLAQAYVKGQEYVVNAVSRDGRPHFSEIWQINKTLMPGGNLVYDHGILLDARGPVQDTLTGYVGRVLDVLGIRNGASHSELMLTDRGPVLIEIGARLAGSISHRTTGRAVGCSHASLLAEAWFDEDRFRVRSAAPYLRREHARFVSLISRQSGTIAGLKRLHDVFELPSFSQAVNCPKAGDAIRPTEDLFTSPGLIYLVDPDPGVVEADHRRIRQWEAEGFFELEP